MNNEQQKFCDECVESRKFNNEQIAQIYLGVLKGLAIEQVKNYTDPKFNADQMEQSRGNKI